MTKQNPTALTEAESAATAPTVGDSQLCWIGIAEAVLADAIRTEAPRLPTDSAERKRTPLCTGCFDYFPAAIQAISTLADDYLGEHVIALCIPEYLLTRDLVCLAMAAVGLLQAEIEGRLLDPDESVELTAGLTPFVDAYGAALAEIARVSWHGNEKHNPGQALHHSRGKSMDHADCIARHFVERGGFDGPLRHTACLAWRALALLQEHLEENGAPLARGAVLP